jgi:hypothetical protein
VTGPTLQPAIKVYPFLTVIPNRHPAQKLHTSLGHAKNAVHARMFYVRNGGYATTVPIQLYKYENDDWVLLYDIPSGTRKDDLPWLN